MLRCADPNLRGVAPFIGSSLACYIQGRKIPSERMIEGIKDVKACHLGWIEFEKMDLQTQHESSDTLFGGENGS